MITPRVARPTSAELNDEGKFQRLLEDHLPLVRSIISRMKRKLPDKIEADELYSVGLTGLVTAARNIGAPRDVLLPPMRPLEFVAQLWMSCDGWTR
jgi:hypothetical protein